MIPFFVPFAAGKSSAVTKAREFRECNHIEFKESNHIGLDVLPLQCYIFCKQGSGIGPLLICFEKDRVLL